MVIAAFTQIFKQKKKILGISDLYFCFEIRNTKTKLSLKNQKSFKKPTSSIHDLIISTFIFLSLKRDCRKDKKKLATECNPAILQSCNPAILQSCNPAILQSCNPAILQSCNPVVQ
jgi:predicted MPP superfamily phosphohydrolase